jgi:uncharacterized protein (DUF1697 family)
MRIYVVAGAIGSGITEVCLEIQRELTALGCRVARTTIGSPDTIQISEQMSAEEVIDRATRAMENPVNAPTDFIISGTEATRHCLAIKNAWPHDTRIIFVRKVNDERALESGLFLLEHHVDYNRNTYEVWLKDQIQTVNKYASDLSLSWHNVEARNMIVIDKHAVVAYKTITDSTIAINPYTGSLSNDCIPRQLAIH